MPSSDDRPSEVEELREEVSYLQNTIQNLEGKIEYQAIEKDQLTADIVELAAYIKELEVALMEAHLMSKEDPHEDTKAKTS